jgi:ATP-binding cassette, subfamily B, bacterial
MRRRGPYHRALAGVCQHSTAMNEPFQFDSGSVRTNSEQMTDLSQYSDRPVDFMYRFIRRRWLTHAAILACVLLAVVCSVSAQYGVKFLVDALSEGIGGMRHVWNAFLILVLLIAADNLLWRIAGLIANFSFVGVTGDLRRDLFSHLTAHAPSYFADRLPGTLASRVTATSNAVFTTETMFVWNVLPPCAATVAAIAFVGAISLPIAATLMVVAGVMIVAMFCMAAAGRPLHHNFAEKTASVDGEMVDVLSNMPIVRAFCGLSRERHRFDSIVDQEMTARRSSLLYLERLRILHASVIVMLTGGLLAWAILLWQRGEATTGDVVLVCTLGLSVLHATRDLAVALVDVTQHIARLSEALLTLLLPHQLRDHPEAVSLVKRGTSIAFENISFCFPQGQRVFENLSLSLEPGQRTGLVGPSGAGKSTLFALLQRDYDVQGGRILIDGQDISRATQQSLRETIAVVPQDFSLFHRSAMENIRYGRADASDDEVFEAAIAARCYDFIEALPEGFKTIVGERGLKLSGGQRQRIAIARAFLKNAPLLLLDEATSALDSESEEAIQGALANLMHGRTVIAIAHRLSTLRNFDHIVVLRAGQILEIGSPALLMKNDGLYRAFVKREMSHFATRAA